MSTRQIAQTILLLSILLIVMSVMPACKNIAVNGRTPNIILILADDLGYGDLSCYGQTNFSTPHIDALADEGIKFTNHYAGATVCSPSRNVLMTGMHTGHCYVRGNGRNPAGEGDLPLPADRKTFAEFLKQRGYKTGIFGKWGLGNCGTEGSPLAHGFDEFYGYTDQILAHNSFPEYLIKNCKKIYLNNKVKYLSKKAWHKGLGSISLRKVDYSNDLIFDAALNFIDVHKDEPFFLYFSTTIPHMNDEAEVGKRFETPDTSGFADKSWSRDEKNYALLIKRLDGYVGEISRKINELNLQNNTLIIFTSDNGPVHGIDNLDSNGDLRGYKRDLYEGGIRVPFMAKWPGKIKAGTVSGHISAFQDYFPTLLDAAGVKNYPETDGISFLPTLLDSGGQREHKYLYWEFHWWKPSRQAIRMDKWKAVKNSPQAEMELYDLDQDISEENNVALQHPDIVKKITELFKIARTEDKRWPLKE